PWERAGGVLPDAVGAGTARRARAGRRDRAHAACPRRGRRRDDRAGHGPRSLRGAAMRAARARDGQGAVELVALLPLVVAVALAILQALAAGVAVELAGHAAQSGA